MRDPAAPLNRSASLPGRIPTEKANARLEIYRPVVSNIQAPIPAWNPQMKLHDLDLSGNAYKVRLFLPSSAARRRCGRSISSTASTRPRPSSA